MRWILGLACALFACGEDAEIALEGTSSGNGGCKSSHDCTAENKYCALDLGRCVECLEDTQCSGDEKCASDHECRHFCQSSDQCGEYVCNTSEGVCVECVRPEDCASGEYHYCSASHECRECLSNEQCVAPKTCDPIEFQCKD